MLDYVLVVENLACARQCIRYREIGWVQGNKSGVGDCFGYRGRYQILDKALVLVVGG